MPSRILVKLSGEALMGSAGYGIDPTFLASVAGELKQAHDYGSQLAIVIGGGNIFRGLSQSATGMERSSADHMGMLATVINALAMQNALEAAGVPTVVQSAIAMPQVAESFNQRAAVAHLDAGRVVLFAAGTGNPYFTTDTAASLRAAEIHATLLVKGTKVDGVYDADPVKYPHAQRFERLSYDQVLEKRLKVMDLTAITLCRDNGVPIRVLSMKEPGSLAAALMDEPRGTLIKEA